MTAITQQPTNLNTLTNVTFKLTFRRIPNFEFFVQSVTLPDITLGGPVFAATPFIDISLAGEKITFGQLITTIIIDEDMKSYTEIYNWILGLGFPENHEEFKNIRDGEGLKDEASLIILSNNMNPIFELIFQDIFPVNLSPVDFTSIDTDILPVTVPVSFAFTGPFKIKKIT